MLSHVNPSTSYAIENNLPNINATNSLYKTHNNMILDNNVKNLNYMPSFKILLHLSQNLSSLKSVSDNELLKCITHLLI